MKGGREGGRRLRWEADNKDLSELKKKRKPSLYLGEGDRRC